VFLLELDCRKRNTLVVQQECSWYNAMSALPEETKVHRNRADVSHKDRQQRNTLVVQRECPWYNAMSALPEEEKKCKGIVQMYHKKIVNFVLLDIFKLLAL
jgi:(2Fe-2S) ferredoxin